MTEVVHEAVHVDLGERLRAIRQLRRKTLKEVASAAAISESFLSQLERGRTNATIATLQRLSTALGIEVSDLFTTGRPQRPLPELDTASRLEPGRRDRRGDVRDQSAQLLEGSGTEHGCRRQTGETARPPDAP